MKHLIKITALLCTFAISTATQAATFDHSYPNYSVVLSQHVKGGLVDYAKLKANPKALQGFLDAAAGVTQDAFNGWTQAQQIAFLINLYNADTLKLIIENHPVESIRDTDWLTYPWRKDRISLFGDEASLSHVENDLLRANYNEPRIHFALVCASISCPPLINTPYTSDQLDAQLDSQTKQYLADTRQNRYAAAKQTLHLSKIFDWYEEDFGDLASYVLQYLPEQTRTKIKNTNVDIEFSDYDWGLNEQN